MKNLVIATVLTVLSSFGCVAHAEPLPPPAHPVSGCVQVVDEFGSHTVCSQYYYTGGFVTYWDPYYNVWIHPHGYWSGGRWFHGRLPGWRGWRGHR